MRIVRAASEAPATPATRLRFETRPSFAPSTAARTVLPAIERWLACSAAHDGIAAGWVALARLRFGARGHGGRCECTRGGAGRA